MQFIETGFAGAYIIELDVLSDSRGFFARSWCHKEAESHGIKVDWVQCNISFSRQKGTLRGMHFQKPPHLEDKLIRVTKGAVLDIIVDIREGSPTYLKWYQAELSANNRKMLFAPKGFAHGFLTLEKDTEMFYQLSEYYHPESASGLRYNDPAINIKWPDSQITALSERDMQFPLLSP